MNNKYEHFMFYLVIDLKYFIQKIVWMCPCNMTQNDTRIYRYSRGQIAMFTEQLLKAVCDLQGWPQWNCDVLPVKLQLPGLTILVTYIIIYITW